MKWLLVGIIALCNTIGDVLNTAGMKRQGEVEDLRPGAVAGNHGQKDHSQSAGPRRIRRAGRVIFRAAFPALDNHRQLRGSGDRNQLSS